MLLAGEFDILLPWAGAGDFPILNNEDIADIVTNDQKVYEYQS